MKSMPTCRSLIVSGIGQRDSGEGEEAQGQIPTLEATCWLESSVFEKNNIDTNFHLSFLKFI